MPFTKAMPVTRACLSWARFQRRRLRQSCRTCKSQWVASLGISWAMTTIGRRTLLPSDVVAFMKQFHNQGLDQSVTAIATLVEQSAIAAMGPAAKGLLIPAGYFADATQGAKTFEAAYKAELGSNAPAQNFIALNGYDALHLWALAVQKAGSVDKDAVTKALPEVARDGPRGKVAYSATTRHVTFPIYLARI